MILRSPGYVSVGSRLYQEWQKPAFEDTKEEEELPEIDGPLVEYSSYPTPTRILKRPTKDIEESSVEEVESKLEGDMSMSEHVDEQDNLEGTLPGQWPVVINAITTPGRISDGDDGDMVRDPVSDQPEQKSESETGISMRLTAIVDINTPAHVI